MGLDRRELRRAVSRRSLPKVGAAGLHIRMVPPRRHRAFPLLEFA